MKGQFDALPVPRWWQHPTVARVLPVVWVAFLGFVMFFNGLGRIGLVDETEPLFVEAARQMTVTGNWITPYFNEVTRFDKPPLIYWLMSTAFHIVGVNEWGARLPSAIAGTLLTGFCFYVLRGLTADSEDEKSSLIVRIMPYLGSAIAALNLMTLFFGRLGYSDMLLSVCFGGSLFSFFLGYVQPNPNMRIRWYLAFYGLMALGVLTKGPVGVVLPSAIVLIFLVLMGNWREVLPEMKPIFGTIIFLVISVPWFILVYLQNGSAYIDSFFGVHNVQRFTSVVNQHSGGWYYHLLIVLGGFFPWSISLPTAITTVLTQSRQKSRSEQFGWFALIWFGVVLGFFTIAVTKYITYTLPLFPAAAILVALWWKQQMVRHHQSRSLKLTVYVSIAFSVALAICMLYGPRWLNDDPSMPNLGVRLQESGLPTIAAIIWIGAAIAGLMLAVRHQLRWYWSINLVAFIAFVLFFITPGLTVVDAERQLPLRQIAQAIVQVRQSNEPIVMATNLFEKPSLVFYTDQTIRFLARPREIVPYFEELRANDGLQSTLLITTVRTLEEANLKPNQYQFIQQNGVYQLFRVPLAATLSSPKN
jgi:4-amino-4-deoxy-L-arabinose transferase-like glycosyltransferase